MLINMRLLALLLCSLLFFGGLASCKKNTNTSTQKLTTQTSTDSSKNIFNFAPTIRVTKDAIEQNGSIVFIEERGQPDFRLAKFDLETKNVTTVFQIPEGGWVYQVDAANTGNQQLVMSYTKPSEEMKFDRSGIYLLDISNADAQAELLVGSDEAFVYYYDPVFSVDNEYVYYMVSDSVNRSLRLERINLVTKAIDLIAENALWPKVSPDGTSIVYLAINQETSARSLIKAELDSSNPQTLISENQLPDLDLPFFSADGEWVYVSVPNTETEEASIWQNLLGVAGMAYAHGNHDVPSDWWRVSIQGDEFEQVNQESVIHYFGDMSETDTLGFTANKGFYIFDGEESKLILSSRTVRAFTWLN